MAGSTVRHQRPKEAMHTSQLQFIVWVAETAPGKLPSDVAEHVFEFLAAPPGEAKRVHQHSFQVNDARTKTGLHSVMWIDEELTAQMGVQQPQLWLRKHRADSGLVDARYKKGRIDEVIATLSCMLVAVGTIPEGTRVTVEEIARPPRDMPKRKFDAHRAKIEDFIANVVQTSRSKTSETRSNSTETIKQG